jgi:hypothetical protein
MKIMNLFNSLKTNHYKPKYLLADAADQITLGFKKAFGDDYTRIMYWAHAERAIASRVTHVKDKEIENQIMNDIYKIQAAYSINSFRIAIKLFLEKWKKQNFECIRFFELF